MAFGAGVGNCFAFCGIGIGDGTLYLLWSLEPPVTLASGREHFFPLRHILARVSLLLASSVLLDAHFLLALLVVDWRVRLLLPALQQCSHATSHASSTPY